MENDLIFSDFNGNTMQHLMANGFDVQCLRTNTTLRKDEWEMLDTIIIEVARNRLRAAQDLFARGLVKPVDGMATTILQWQTQSRTGEVNVNMDPQVEGRSEALNFELEQLPLPIFSADYQIGLRQLNISRRNGNAGLDTLMAAQKSLDIAEKVEDTLINGLIYGGLNYAYAGATVYGYTTFPDRATTTITDWTVATGAAIVTQVLAMVQAQFNQKSFGSYTLYIPLAYATALQEDYKAESDDTIEERIMAIKEIDSIKVLDLLTTNNVLLVQLTSDKVQMVEGMPFSNVQWDEKGGMTSHFAIMTIMVPRLFKDQDGNTGIVHGSV